MDDCSLLLQFAEEKPKMTGKVDIFTYVNELANRFVAVKPSRKKVPSQAIVFQEASDEFDFDSKSRHHQSRNGQVEDRWQRKRCGLFSICRQNLTVT